MKTFNNAVAVLAASVCTSLAVCAQQFRAPEAQLLVSEHEVCFEARYLEPAVYGAVFVSGDGELIEVRVPEARKFLAHAVLFGAGEVTEGRLSVFAKVGAKDVTKTLWFQMVVAYPDGTLGVYPPRHVSELVGRHYFLVVFPGDRPTRDLLEEKGVFVRPIDSPTWDLLDEPVFRRLEEKGTYMRPIDLPKWDLLDEPIFRRLEEKGAYVRPIDLPKWDLLDEPEARRYEEEEPVFAVLFRVDRPKPNLFEEPEARRPEEDKPIFALLVRVDRPKWDLLEEPDARRYEDPGEPDARRYEDPGEPDARRYDDPVVGEPVAERLADPDARSIDPNRPDSRRFEDPDVPLWRRFGDGPIPRRWNGK